MHTMTTTILATVVVFAAMLSEVLRRVSVAKIGNQVPSSRP
jgi:hypothetical protein